MIQRARGDGRRTDFCAGVGTHCSVVEGTLAAREKGSVLHEFQKGLGRPAQQKAVSLLWSSLCRFIL